MNRQRLTMFVMIALALVTAEARQTQDWSAIVAQHYPTVLIEEGIKIRGVETPRKQCFATVEASSTGVPQVVIAGYTNTLNGAVRVLGASGAGFGVVAGTEAEDFAGWACEAEAIDIDNDGRKEAVVRFQTDNSSEDWVFRWDGVSLQNVSPTTTDALGLVGTQLTNTSFVDIDGDGVLEAFSSHLPLREGQPLPGEIFKMIDGALVPDRRMVGMRAFQRASGSPETETHEILLPTGAVGPLTVHIYNGTGTSVSGQRVENAVESGRVWWNGQQIAAPNDFGSQVFSIQRTVTPQLENELKVRLAGSPGGRITIVIDAASWTP